MISHQKLALQQNLPIDKLTEIFAYISAENFDKKLHGRKFENITLFFEIKSVIYQCPFNKNIKNDYLVKIDQFTHQIELEKLISVFRPI